ncbi:MAG: hypothetical protein K6G42_03480, partial [Lachnospiraceae bacterium]|nr:hypothetical protein [Lachnospiraceae bacterium]
MDNRRQCFRDKKADHNRRRSSRFIAVLLIAALMISGNPVAVFADGVSDNSSANENSYTESATADQEVTSVDNDATEEQTTEAVSADTTSVSENVSSEAAVSGDSATVSAVSADPTSEVDEVSVSEDIASASDNTVSGDETDGYEYFGYIEGEEAHGEAGQALRRRLFSAAVGDLDYYHEYYNQLGEYGKQIYQFMVDNADKFIDAETMPELIIECEGYSLTHEGLVEAIDDVMAQQNKAHAAFDLDHPEIFWLYNNAFKWEYYGSTANGAVTVKVIPSAKAGYDSLTIYEDRAAVEADRSEMESNISTILTEETYKDEIYDQLAVINDWLSNNNYYNRYVSKGYSERANDKTWKSSAALTAQEWLSSAGDYGDSSAPVCEAYARAFKVVCDRLDIPCILVLGESHMWNYVQTDDGNWYAVDVTWDDPVRSNEYTERITPDNYIHRYLMVGNDTVVEGETKTFLEDGHQPNGTFWAGGEVLPTPSISSERYEKPTSLSIEIKTIPGTDEASSGKDDTLLIGKKYALQYEVTPTSFKDQVNIDSITSSDESIISVADDKS